MDGLILTSLPDQLFPSDAFLNTNTNTNTLRPLTHPSDLPNVTPASSSAATSAPAHASPTSSSSSKRKADSTPAGDDAETTLKRQRNTMAARKYRQKRLDRVADLEKALGEVSGERDELKLQLARREAEVEALRDMLARK